MIKALQGDMREMLKETTANPCRRNLVHAADTVHCTTLFALLPCMQHSNVAHMVTVSCVHTELDMPALLQAKLQQRQQSAFVSSWLDQQPLALKTRHPF